MLDGNVQQLMQFVARQPMRLGHLRERIKPELGNRTALSDMNMQRLSNFDMPY
jgi:hypothetical protein